MSAIKVAVERGLCNGCVPDAYLAALLKKTGVAIKCVECGKRRSKGIALEDLARRMEPIMRRHFVHGEEERFFGEDDDKGWLEQKGEGLNWVIGEVLGGDLECVDELIDAIRDAERVWPPDGDEHYWDSSVLYEERPASSVDHERRWDGVAEELGTRRRFYSSAARMLFDELFRGIESLQVLGGGAVVKTLKRGTRLFRARHILMDDGLLANIMRNPARYVGPPPGGAAGAGRMNAEGVAVLYAALDAATALAEVRPVLGSRVASIQLETTRALRVLDMQSLEKAFSRDPLSYFDPRFEEEVSRRKFLRELHAMIARPVVPSRESSYLITQNLAEYLSHVIEEPFDGVLFSSSQRRSGTNVVIFPSSASAGKMSAKFRVRYVKGSLNVQETVSISYKHEELGTYLGKGGRWIAYRLGFG